MGQLDNPFQKSKWDKEQEERRAENVPALDKDLERDPKLLEKTAAEAAKRAGDLQEKADGIATTDISATELAALSGALSKETLQELADKLGQEAEQLEQQRRGEPPPEAEEPPLKKAA